MSRRQMIQVSWVPETPFSPSPYTTHQTLMSKLGSSLLGENTMVLLSLQPEAYKQDNELLAHQQNITQLN